eukprot:gene12112-4244_t
MKKTLVDKLVDVPVVVGGVAFIAWLAEGGGLQSRLWTAGATFAITMGTWHGYGAVQQWMDARLLNNTKQQEQQQPWWAKYKLHTKDTLTYYDMLPNVLFNQFAVFLPALVLLAFASDDGRGLRLDNGRPPTVPMMLLHLVGLVASYEYAAYHKKHHQTFASVGISGQYATALDFFMMQAGPVIVGTYVLNCHAATVWLFAIIGSLNSIHSHGAYRFPLMPVPDAHDLHHSKFHWNFGTGPLDKAHGT